MARSSRGGGTSPTPSRSSYNVTRRSRSDAGRYSRANYSSSRQNATPRYSSMEPVGGYGSASSQVSNPYSRTSANYYGRGKNRMSTGKKVAIVIVVALLVVLAALAIWAVKFIGSVNDSLGGDLTDEEQLAIVDTLEPTEAVTDPFYIMLVGSDARVEDEWMGARSDTNIVAYVNPPAQTVTLISIPRDTMITIPDYGTNKFNAALNYCGYAGVIDAANNLLGIRISHYAAVDFNSLIALVDAIGGVDVEVPERIDDPDAGNIVIEAGWQHLDGTASLVFARSRAYYDGDFTRQSNQRLLIEAIINKVLSLSLPELPGAIQACAACVTTDLTVQDLFNLASEFRNMENFTMYSVMVPSTTADIDGVAYVLVDEEGLANVMAAIEAGQDPNTVETYGSTGSILYSDYYDSLVNGADTGYYDTGYYDDGSGYYYDDGSGYYDDGSGYYDDGSGGYYDEYGNWVAA